MVLPTNGLPVPSHDNLITHVLLGALCSECAVAIVVGQATISHLILQGSLGSEVVVVVASEVSLIESLVEPLGKA